MDFHKAPFLISDDPQRLDIALIHRFLDQASYWAQGISVEKLQKSIDHALSFGVYDTRNNQQVGYARVISDFSRVAYLADVFIVPEYRQQGLSKWLMECILAHPDLQGLRNFFLTTDDAHGLYAQFGFVVHPHPERMMVRFNPHAYEENE